MKYLDGVRLPWHNPAHVPQVRPRGPGSPWPETPRLHRESLGQIRHREVQKVRFFQKKEKNFMIFANIKITIAAKRLYHQAVKYFCKKNQQSKKSKTMPQNRSRKSKRDIYSQYARIYNRIQDNGGNDERTDRVTRIANRYVNNINKANGGSAPSDKKVSRTR